jgi:hypothetical protein
MALRLPSLGIWERLRPGEGVARMDTEGFRDKTDEALTQGEEEVDERTGAASTSRPTVRPMRSGSAAAALSATSRRATLRRTSLSRSSDG